MLHFETVLDFLQKIVLSFWKKKILFLKSEYLHFSKKNKKKYFVELRVFQKKKKTIFLFYELQKELHSTQLIF